MRRVRERLSDLSKLCLCILLAYMIALPGMGANTLVNTAIADTLGNTTGLDLDLAAFSAERTASPQSLAEAKAALFAAIAEHRCCKEERCTRIRCSEG